MGQEFSSTAPKETKSINFLLKNPKAKIKGFEDIHPGDDSNVSDVKLPSPNEDRELTPAEKKELERLEKKVSFFYADPDIAADMKRPEKIYDYLYNLLPKCPKCGGQFAVESKIRTRIPLGFGFAGSDGRFQVDVIETLSHGGFCLKCRK